jgi:hypothetical protein
MEEHVNLTSGLSQSKPNRPSGQLSSASNTRHLADTGGTQHKQYAESLARANLRGWMHQSANDSIRSVHRLLDNVASLTFGFSSTTMNHNNSTQSKTNDQRNPAENGVQFKTTRDVVYGYLGIGLRHLGPEQGCNRPFYS